jgi:hypothetical protein
VLVRLTGLAAKVERLLIVDQAQADIMAVDVSGFTTSEAAIAIRKSRSGAG